MSQLRHISRSVRAVIAIIAAFALMFSVSASGAAAADATDIVLKNNSSASAGLFACFKRHMTQRADSGAEKTTQEQGPAKHHCPCCLAAHSAAAVLPPRLATPAAPLRAPIRFCLLAATAHEPESVAFHAAHGARAPPV
ncbi:DUF2946 family protein [Methylocystis sp. IM3]|uniref:DUF2946 family protein n=1 Tax=unclassified Methylocystis TaxID=2625913 RepID=UPI000FA942E9|nr:MAG: hypothetical protein EKK29_02260 [Hyphomicrobiales bacterium]